VKVCLCLELFDIPAAAADWKQRSGLADLRSLRGQTLLALGQQPRLLPLDPLQSLPLSLFALQKTLQASQCSVSLPWWTGELVAVAAAASALPMFHQSL
jgi:hypothetical protein